MSKKESAINKYLSDNYKKVIGITLFIVAIVVLVTISWRDKLPEVSDVEVVQQKGNYKSDMVYYYGQECKHCDNVEKFIQDNEIDAVISFAKKEVWHDAVNDMEFRERMRGCNLDPEKTGVPLIWARGKCYVGQTEVQKFLKEETKTN